MFFICSLGERRKVLNWLLSYNPLWLRIGLEVFWNRAFLSLFLFFHTFPSVHLSHPAPSQTIYGELISLESNSDVLGLAMFILLRLLWNPDIAAEFRHAKVPHLYKDGNSRFPGFKLKWNIQVLKPCVGQVTRRRCHASLWRSCCCWSAFWTEPKSRAWLSTTPACSAWMQSSR